MCQNLGPPVVELMWYWNNIVIHFSPFSFVFIGKSSIFLPVRKLFIEGPCNGPIWYRLEGHETVVQQWLVLSCT